jgi:hypothetical protein
MNRPATAGAVFITLGAAFIALGVSGQRVFLGVGAAFLAIGTLAAMRQVRAHHTKRSGTDWP